MNIVMVIRLIGGILIILMSLLLAFDDDGGRSISGYGIIIFVVFRFIVGVDVLAAFWNCSPACVMNVFLIFFLDSFFLGFLVRWLGSILAGLGGVLAGLLTMGVWGADIIDGLLNFSIHPLIYAVPVVAFIIAFLIQRIVEG